MGRMIFTTAMVATLLGVGSVQAAVKLSGVFGSHMVIQQEQPIRVFGSAEPGEKVTVTLAGRTASATAGGDGTFRVELPAMKADGKAHTLMVTGKNAITLGPGTKGPRE